LKYQVLTIRPAQRTTIRAADQLARVWNASKLSSHALMRSALRGRIDLMRRIATIGVYEFDAESFIETLDTAGVTKLIDIRQRRGVRGTQYAWANAKRLQGLLSVAQISYEHHPEFAPDTELRHLQYREDDREDVGKRSRVRLAPEYVRRYTEEILDLVPLDPLVRQLPVHSIAALMCVEATAQACHRSLNAFGC
jgi:uncharacterized protein (DUF488 family)